jgi:hypothetical protein
MTLTVKSCIDACRELGFVCSHSDGEFRLARRLTDYRNMATEHQRRLQELHAYYTDDAEDCVGTAMSWAMNLGWLEPITIRNPLG